MKIKELKKKLKAFAAGEKNIFVGVDLSGVDLSEADLREANLSEVDLGGANLSKANLSRADLSMANLSKANLSRADLSMANLREANLIGAILYKSNLRIADLSKADLREADLRRAELIGADLRRADLGGADLRRADLSVADFRRAHLFVANLSGADLSGAVLREADLREAELYRTKGLVKIIGVEPGNVYWKRFYKGLNNNGFQFYVGRNEVFNFCADERELCSYPGLHFASRSWCAVNCPDRPLEAKIRIPLDAQINEPWATDGKASASAIEILQVFDTVTGKDVTEKYRRPE